MSKWFYTKLFLIGIIIAMQTCHAQQPQAIDEEKLENNGDDAVNGIDDDQYLVSLEQYRRRPINLNSADADQLKALNILTEIQIENLRKYRILFGNFIHIYELQAIPGWDVGTVRKLMNFVTIREPLNVQKEFSKRFRFGEHVLLLRTTRVIEKAKGFKNLGNGSIYIGNPIAVLFRYRYTYKSNLQFGITGDKDPGENFLKGRQGTGFDFYSIHLFAADLGIIKALALGDFTVNMGQGLIQWQGLAFRKSADVMSIKRQSTVLKSYHGAGEFYFFRGCGITLKKGKFETTFFGSIRRSDANIDRDSSSGNSFITSFLTAGVHRTNDEKEKKGNVKQGTGGLNIRYKGLRWSCGLNGIYYQFSKIIRKRNEPYNRFALHGDRWINASIDYSYTFRNIHVFGEFAIDKNLTRAILNGLLISIDNKTDLSILCRLIDKAYQTMNGNAFTENSFPTNEQGIYTGITIRPAIGWRIDAYADYFKFPWLKYRVDAPSQGYGFLIQLTYTPSKLVEIYSRYQVESKQMNNVAIINPTHDLVNVPIRHWRTHITFKLNRTVTLRNRVEMVWYDQKTSNGQQGFLMFVDFLYKPMMKPFSFSGRLQFFDTGGYESRIYAYENDVLYSYTVPSFSDRGIRYYLNINYDLSKKISVWLRWGQTIYNNIDRIGTGLDEIEGNQKSEFRIQFRALF